MDPLKDITLEDLPEDNRKVAVLIGLEAYCKLVEVYGGLQPLYIPKFSEIEREIRNREIRGKFDGYNFEQLAREYDLTEVTIRKITREITREIRQKPLDGQESLF